MSLHVCNEYLFFVIIDTKLSYMIRKPNLGRARDVINHWRPVQLHREIVVVEVYTKARRPFVVVLLFSAVIVVCPHTEC